MNDIVRPILQLDPTVDDQNRKGVRREAASTASDTDRRRPTDCRIYPIGEGVIVTLPGNGAGVAGIGRADGNANVAVAADGLLTSYPKFRPAGRGS